MKVRSRELDNRFRMEVLDTLYTAAGTIRGRDSAKDFMRELLTESERIMLGRRILIARELLFGSTYDEIVEKYKVGKDTILRVAKWLDDQFPGYENTVADVDREFAERKQKADDRYMYATSALYRLKKKYPLHFLLFPLPRKNK